MARRSGQSRLSAVFTIIKCNWGIGMMAMPYMLYSSGAISGVIMFTLSMLLTQFAIVNLIDTKNELSKIPTDESQSLLAGESINSEKVGVLEYPEHNRRDLDYSTIMAKALGPFGDWGALFSIVFSSYGSNVAYVLFVYDNMNKFFPAAMPHPTLWVWIQVLPLVGLAWFDSIDFMAPFSLFGLMCAFSFATLAVYNTASSLSPDEFYDTLKEEPIFKADSFALAVSIAAFCNEGIVVLSPSTHSAMARPETYTWTAFWGICFFVVCYMSVGLSGTILYHGDVKSEMSLNFETFGDKYRLYQVAVVLYSLQLIATYGVVFFVAYEALEAKWLRHFGIKDRVTHLTEKGLRTKLPYFANRTFWILASGVIALQIPKFGDYLGLIGALGTSLAIYIMPQVAYLRVVKKKPGTMNKIRRVGCVLLTLAGVVLAVAGTYVSIEGLMEPVKSTTTTPMPTHLMSSTTTHHAATLVE